jgi:homoserine O-acetyltransferase/O-succinyltransferase
MSQKRTATQAEAPAMSDHQIFEASNIQLQKGGFLPTVRLAYKTVGTLNARRDNAVVVPTWYTGTHDDLEARLVGPGRAIDPEKHFVIMPNLLGNGLSSSPSNMPAPFERGRFPRITLHDNVRLQQMLVRDRLGLARLRLVAGISMGACQAFQWAAQYPDMVAAIAPIVGAARTGAFNKVFLLSLQRALELDPAFAEGFYERPPVRGLQAFATIYAGWGFSEPFYRTAAYRQLGAADWADFVAMFWEPFFLRCDANDLLSQLWTWMHADISDNPTYGGDFEKALGAIRARTVIVPCQHDAYFPPADSEYEARHIPGAQVRVIPSIWGHMATTNPADAPFIDRAIAEALGDD